MFGLLRRKSKAGPAAAAEADAAKDKDKDKSKGSGAPPLPPSKAASAPAPAETETERVRAEDVLPPQSPTEGDSRRRQNSRRLSAAAIGKKPLSYNGSLPLLRGLERERLTRPRSLLVGADEGAAEPRLSPGDPPLSFVSQRPGVPESAPVGVPADRRR